MFLLTLNKALMSTEISGQAGAAWIHEAPRRVSAQASPPEAKVLPPPLQPNVAIQPSRLFLLHPHLLTAGIPTLLNQTQEKHSDPGVASQVLETPIL